jgi:predicted short-subunit dehydrogenase-like oxidoreductase (DUF2520 family)
MIQVSIIGSGNVAQHLIKAFSKTSEIELVQVYSRKPEVLFSLVPNHKIISDYGLLKAVDLLIIAVTDNAIVDISNQIPFKNQLVVHTSGTVSMDALNSKNRHGVFYPLQTFSASKEIDFSLVPICLEATTEKDYLILESTAKSISDVRYNINSEQRKALHVAAVFVSNFVNYLYQIGNELCLKNELPFDILKPLIIETANKIKTLTPAEAQTGPAKRNDSQTINAQLSFLSDENQKEIYKLLTKSIIDNGKKL